jgi:hypothetical protein
VGEAVDIYGARSVTVVDRLARATVWSTTFAPDDASVNDGGADHGGATDGRQAVQARIADDVLATVSAVDRLFPAGDEADGWFEVILMSPGRYHILRPFGPASDALVIELGLDARSTNLAAARQRFSDLLAPYQNAGPATDDSAVPVVVPAAAEASVAASGLPRRASRGLTADGRREVDAGRPIDERLLHRIVAGLRAPVD